jgi:hypothetical protein
MMRICSGRRPKTPDPTFFGTLQQTKGIGTRTIGCSCARRRWRLRVEASVRFVQRTIALPRASYEHFETEVEATES